MVAYRAVTGAGIDGIYTGAGNKVVDSSSMFSSFNEPALNDNGLLAYRAVLDSGVEGIYTDAGAKVVDSNALTIY